MRDMLSFGRNSEGRGALGVVGSSRPRSARGGSGTRPNRLGGLPFSLLEAVRSLERVGGLGGYEEHDPSRENTGDGSTHHLPPNKPGQQKPSKDAGAHRFLLRAQKWTRSEEHTSELQSPCNLVCRLLLEKKKKKKRLLIPRVNASLQVTERRHGMLIVLG